MVGRAIVLTAVVLGCLPGAASAQESPDLIGFLNKAGTVVPFATYEAGGWSEASEVVWRSIDQYYTRDSLGAPIRLVAGDSVAICCDDLGNETWAHQTDHPPREVLDPFVNSDWFVSTRLRDEAVFFRSRSTVVVSTLVAVIDSLSPIADTIATALDVRTWRPATGDGGYLFFNAMRYGRDRYVQGACLTMFGWLHESSGNRIEVLSAGSDDCEGKGHGRARPWALLRRDGDLFLFVSRYYWADTAEEIWRLRGKEGWELVLSVNHAP